MSDHMRLLGAEEVSRAASSMIESAENMQRAVAEFGYQVDRLERILGEHAERVEAAMKQEQSDDVEAERLAYEEDMRQEQSDE